MALAPLAAVIAAMVAVRVGRKTPHETERFRQRGAAFWFRPILYAAFAIVVWLIATDPHPPHYDPMEGINLHPSTVPSAPNR